MAFRQNAPRTFHIDCKFLFFSSSFPGQFRCTCFGTRLNAPIMVAVITGKLCCPKVGVQRPSVVFVVCVYMFFVGNMFIYHIYCAVKGPSWSVLKVKHHGHGRPCFIAMSGLFVWHVFNGFTCIHMLPVHHVVSCLKQMLIKSVISTLSSIPEFRLPNDTGVTDRKLIFSSMFSLRYEPHGIF